MQQQWPLSKALFTALLCFALAIMVGCRRDFATEADALRTRVMELEREVESLERRNTELRAELAGTSRRRADVPEEVRAATPHVAEISIGRFSHARIARDDDAADELRLYINPLDGRGQFVPLTGILRVSAAVMPEGEAVTIVRAKLDPEQVRDAFRSSFTGTHYTIRLPIDWPKAVDVESARSESVFVRVVYEDGRTGERFIAERSLSWRVGRRGS